MATRDEDQPSAAPDQRFDARGLICPLPVLKARKRLAEMAAGQVLEVLATDPAAPEDFRQFCAATGHALVSLEEADGVARIVLRAGG